MQYPDQKKVVANLLEESGIYSPPVKLSAIAKHWENLQITREEIEGEAFLVDLGALGSHIIVKSDTGVARQRFSVAHEMGHLALVDFGVQISASCQMKRDDSIERWCNNFASELLMPSKWITEYVIGEPIEKLYKITHVISDCFQTSIEASLIKLAEATPVNVARITIDGINCSWSQSKSRESPVDISKYKQDVLAVIQGRIPQKTWFVDEKVACRLQARRIKGDLQEWIAYFVNSDASLIIKTNSEFDLQSGNHEPDNTRNETL